MARQRSSPSQGKDSKAFLEEFAIQFVNTNFRERFVHEATKKPQRLATRICHTIEEIFPDAYAGSRVTFANDDVCVPLSGTDIDLQQMLWSELSPYIERGMGVLIASADNTKFYAETESEHGSPYEIYSGAKAANKKPNKLEQATPRKPSD